MKKRLHKHSVNEENSRAKPKKMPFSITEFSQGKFTLAYLQPLCHRYYRSKLHQNLFAYKMIMCRPENSKGPFLVASLTGLSSNIFIPSIVYWKLNETFWKQTKKTKHGHPLRFEILTPKKQVSGVKFH